MLFNDVGCRNTSCEYPGLLILFNATNGWASYVRKKMYCAVTWYPNIRKVRIQQQCQEYPPAVECSHRPRLNCGIHLALSQLQLMVDFHQDSVSICKALCCVLLPFSFVPMPSTVVTTVREAHVVNVK